MLTLLALPLLVAQDLDWIERTSLPHSGPQRDDYGESVAVCGDTVLVGDSASLDSYGGDGKGAVYVFRVDGHNFTEEALLVPDDLQVHDNYGAPVALVGDTAVVGSWADDDHANASGAVYVFDRTGTRWAQTAKLCASDAGNIHRFGWSLDFDGASIIAGANGVGGAFGAAYVFVQDGNGDWVEEARLQPLGATGNTPNFGHAVAIDGDHVVVGAPNDAEGDGLGAAFVFERNAGVWTQVAKLITPPGVSSHWLGRDVDISGDSLLVGEWFGPDSSALVYDRVGGVWTFTDELLPPAPQSGFARRVVLEGDRAVAATMLGEGEVHVFEREGGVWSLDQSLTASDAHPGHAFGSAIDLDGDRLAVGAYGSLDQYDPGIGYVFDRVAVPGERFCFGDGSGAACPCGNEDTGLRGCKNGTGRGGDLTGAGSNRITEDDLALRLFHLPPDMPGFFAVGTGDVAAGLGAPVYDGLLCISGTVLRGPVFVADDSGYAELIGPLGEIPGAASLAEPGVSLVFQAFYRDVFASPCGSKGNLSNAYRVVFAP